MLGLCLVGTLLVSGHPLIQLTVEDNEYPERGGSLSQTSQTCPYWVTLPSSDSLCMAATELAARLHLDVVKFHLFRDAKRLAIVGCSGSESDSASCVVESIEEDASLSSESKALVVKNGDLDSYLYRNGCNSAIEKSPKCMVASMDAPAGLTGSLSLPASCYQVRCLVEKKERLLEIEPPKVFAAKDVGFVEFLQAKFIDFSFYGKLVFSCILGILIYLLFRGYHAFIQKTSPAAVENLIDQPYDVSNKDGDTVELGRWQLPLDLSAFEKKISDMKHKLHKLPFAHASEDGLDEGSSVMFLGRNIDDPKLVFRNPRVEKDQRVNVPIFTQAIRNSVAASALRDRPGIKAFIPRSMIGSWNTVQGVFQEYVSGSKPVYLQDFKESPQLAVDMALIVLLLRDTDAHDHNYCFDLRKKIALFDLGCSLADRPLPVYDRDCLDNFEILQRLPNILDTPFEQRHIEYMRSIDFPKLYEMWSNFQYDTHLISKVESIIKANRKRANSSVLFPSLSTSHSPRSLPALIGDLLSPRSKPVDIHSSSSSTEAPQGGPLSPKSTRSLPGSEFFPENIPDSDSMRLVNPMDMLKMLELHAKFLLACAEQGKSMLFAAKVMYSGLYDETWIETGGTIDDLPYFEKALLTFANSPDQEPPSLVMDITSEDDVLVGANNSNFLQ
jgi:hypothetical protein